MDKTRAMEAKYVLKDPKLLYADADYKEYGPVGLCLLTSKAYGDLKKEGDWPALAPSKPTSEANLTPVSPSSSDTDTATLTSSSSDSSSTDSKPPLKRTTTSSSSTTNNSSTNNTSDCTKTKDGTPILSQHLWKYVIPSDENQVLEDGSGKKWYYCAKCVCRFTRLKGFYNQTHSTKDHTNRQRKNTFSLSESSFSSSSSADTPSVDMNALAASAESTTDNQSNLSSIEEEETTGEDDAGSLDPNDNLEFTGSWCASILDMFLAQIDATQDFDMDESVNFVLVTSESLVTCYQPSLPFEDPASVAIDDPYDYENYSSSTYKDDNSSVLLEESPILEKELDLSSPQFQTPLLDSGCTQHLSSVALKEPLRFLDDLHEPTVDVSIIISSLQSSYSSTVLNEQSIVLEDSPFHHLDCFHDAIDHHEFFYDAYEVLPELDLDVSSPNPTWFTLIQQYSADFLHLLWDRLSVMLLFVFALFWDTLEYFSTLDLTISSHKLRRSTTTPPHQRICNYP